MIAVVIAAETGISQCNEAYNSCTMCMMANTIFEKRGRCWYAGVPKDQPVSTCSAADGAAWGTRPPCVPGRCGFTRPSEPRSPIRIHNNGPLTGDQEYNDELVDGV